MKRSTFVLIILLSLNACMLMTDFERAYDDVAIGDAGGEGPGPTPECEGACEDFVRCLSSEHERLNDCEATFEGDNTRDFYQGFCQMVCGAEGAQPPPPKPQCVEAYNGAGDPMRAAQQGYVQFARYFCRHGDVPELCAGEPYCGNNKFVSEIESIKGILGSCSGKCEDERLFGEEFWLCMGRKVYQSYTQRDVTLSTFERDLAQHVADCYASVPSPDSRPRPAQPAP